LPASSAWPPGAPPAGGERHGAARHHGRSHRVRGGEGWALVDGERWKVRAATGLQPGQRVRITQVDGLVLEVRPDADANAPPGDSP
jgi:membrane-bound ClpP family serine protease